MPPFTTGSFATTTTCRPHTVPSPVAMPARVLVLAVGPGELRELEEGRARVEERLDALAHQHLPPPGASRSSVRSLTSAPPRTTAGPRVFRGRIRWPRTRASRRRLWRACGAPAPRTRAAPSAGRHTRAASMVPVRACPSACLRNQGQQGHLGVVAVQQTQPSGRSPRFCCGRKKDCSKRKSTQSCGTGVGTRGARTPPSTRQDHHVSAVRALLTAPWLLRHLPKKRRFCHFAVVKGSSTAATTCNLGATAQMASSD